MIPQTLAALDGWRFWKAEGTATERTEITAADIMEALRIRDLYALLEHGQISHAGTRYYSEPA